MKTLKDLYNEVYRPKSPNEQQFVDLHKTETVPDRNEVDGKANGDDVFKASNIKMGSRSKTRHGYDPGEDEKAYDLPTQDDKKKVAEEVEEIDEKTLTKAEIKKREELVKKMKGKGWSQKYGKRGEEVMYATATKMAKKVAEETEEIEEGHGRMDQDEYLAREKRNISMKLAKKHNPSAFKMNKEEIINRTIEKFMPEVSEATPMTMEERIVSKLSDISESHIHMLLNLFHSLNEDNQFKMISKADTREGIMELLNFAIEMKGSE